MILNLNLKLSGKERFLGKHLCSINMDKITVDRHIWTRMGKCQITTRHNLSELFSIDGTFIVETDDRKRVRGGQSTKIFQGGLTKLTLIIQIPCLVKYNDVC